MSAASCTGRYICTNKFKIIHFDDGNISEGFLYESVHCLIPHVCEIEGSE